MVSSRPNTGGSSCPRAGTAPAGRHLELRGGRDDNTNTNMISITDTQKIGVGFVAFGMTFIFLGVILLFDKGLLAIGNILFLAGMAFIAGLERSFRFFFQRHKWKGSGAFFGGILTVLLGWPLIGMCIEMYGFIVLFSGFFPVAVNFLRRVPVLGQILNLPFISGFVDRLAGESKMNV